MNTILLISPYWKEQHRWMVSSYKLAALWQQLGYRVVVVCMASESGVEEVSDTLTIHRRKDIFLPDPLNYGISFGFAGYVRRVIQQENPDMIICNKVLFWSSLTVPYLRLCGYRVTLLTDVLGGMTWWPRPLFAKVLMLVKAWTIGLLVLWSAERIVTFHPQPPTLLKRLGIFKKTRVIPTGIDASAFEAGSSEIVDRSLEIKDRVTVTYVGRLESVKGVDDFLAAAVPLKKDFPIAIQVVGWHPSTSSGQVLHPLVEQYRHEVIFTGLRDDIPEILSTTDIFVLPSYSEGLSNALMEAMSSSCACVASDVGGNRYLIHNGVSGFLFPPGDREELQSHIRRLIEDRAKRKMMGENARKRIEEVFDWKVVKQLYQGLFQESMITSQPKP